MRTLKALHLTNGFAKWWQKCKSCSLVFQFSCIGLRTFVILFPPLRKAANVLCYFFANATLHIFFGLDVLNFNIF